MKKKTIEIQVAFVWFDDYVE